MKKSVKHSNKKITEERNFDQYEQGTICGTGRGFAFFRSQNYPDLFIPECFTKGAIDGDRVYVKILHIDGERGECKVEKVIERKNTHIVGVLAKTKNEYYVKPDNTKINKNIKIDKKVRNGAKVGDKVVCKLTHQPQNLTGRIWGEVTEILGDPQDNQVMEMSILRSHNIFTEYPKEVVAEADALEKRGIKPADKKNRLDLTAEEIFTIDGADAKDFDDAVSLKILPNGNYCLGVHIADVGNYVKRDSLLDNEAYSRGTSVYFPTMTFAMLPESLSNGICSLQEDVERLTLSVIAEIDKDGNVQNHKICESFIKSKGRLTYEQVYEVLSDKADKNNKAFAFRKTLKLMNQLAKKLQTNRKAAGELDFDIPEASFDIQGDTVVAVKKRERNDAHKLIESFMVLANEIVAKDFCIKKVPFVYRVHEKPTRIKAEDVAHFLNAIGISTPNVPDQIQPDYYAQLIKKVEGSPIKDSLNKVILRSMQKAKYSPECLGHFGLALEYYCHFTSPIRRYPDLVIHRIIKQYLRTKKYDDDLQNFVFEACEQSSLKERNADEAERAVDDLKKAQYMQNHIGECFDGVISSVTNFGFFVELDNTVEGLVKIESLPEQNYLFFEKSFKLKGQKTCYSLGDKVKIKVLASNIYDRKVEFSLAD